MTSEPLELVPDPLPLSRDSAGVIRVAGTRVSLESVVSWYEAGSSVADLAGAFPDLGLSDIHASIAYYLRHREGVERYIEERRRQAREAEQRIRLEFPERYREVRLPVGPTDDSTPE
jgi:uncharacterized protein (DUF433 family)